MRLGRPGTGAPPISRPSGTVLSSFRSRICRPDPRPSQDPTKKLRPSGGLALLQPMYQAANACGEGPNRLSHRCPRDSLWHFYTLASRGCPGSTSRAGPRRIGEFLPSVALLPNPPYRLSSSAEKPGLFDSLKIHLDAVPSLPCGWRACVEQLPTRDGGGAPVPRSWRVGSEPPRK